MHAQNPPEEVAPPETVALDSLREKLYLHLSTDLVAPSISAFSRDYNEASIDLSAYFRYLYLGISMGIAEKNPERENYRYSSSGYFLRLSPGISLRVFDNPQVFFSLGAGYGLSLFKEQLSFTQYSPFLEEDVPYQATQNLQAGWVEAHTGFRMHLYKHLYIGYTIRYMFALHAYQAETFDTYYLPGYRKDNRTSKFLLHYYLSYMLSWEQRKHSP